MTSDEKITIKETIESELLQLNQQIEELTKLSQPIEPDCSLGRLTRVEAMNEQVINLKILDEAKLRKTRLTNALQRIDHEMFGICIECEEPIGIGRMMIRPESIRCVGCAL